MFFHLQWISAVPSNIIPLLNFYNYILLDYEHLKIKKLGLIWLNILTSVFSQGCMTERVAWGWHPLKVQ